MDYICLKPCNMGGKSYITGDLIPGGVVMPHRAKELEEMGLIVPEIKNSVAELQEIESGALDNMMYVTLLEKDSDECTAMPVPIADVQNVIIALQHTASEAAEFVRENIDNSDALELLSRLDKRKAVLSVIEEKTVGET